MDKLTCIEIKIIIGHAKLSLAKATSQLSEKQIKRRISIIKKMEKALKNFNE